MIEVKMVKKYLFILSILFAITYSTPASAQSPSDSVYMFCYFKNNGEDGLHLAFSNDGYNWKALFNDSSVLKPAVSTDKLMRDPCIIRGKDGKFHMVWTVSWNDKGIGYASSFDLLNWSDQKFIPVMKHEKKARNTWAPEITYDNKKDIYIIYWASTITNRFPQTDTSAEGKYNDRIYYITTKEFEKFSPTKLLYDLSFTVIDATILADSGGYLMIFKN